MLSALLVESDRVAAGFLSHQLAADGVDARVARTPAHAIALSVQSAPELIVLGDLEVRRDALELLAAVRGAAAWTGPVPSDVPVLVLSAYAGELDVLRAFDAGADDVMAKPFSYVELRARLRALVRRAAGARRSPGLIRVDAALEIDTRARSVVVGGTRVSLSRLEYQLLLELASDPARVFTRPQLLARVWGFRSQGSTRTVDSHACRLRRKLMGGSRPYVVNVWGVGYSLTAPGSAPPAPHALAVPSTAPKLTPPR